MGHVLTNEIATEEVNRWLSYKKISDKKREEKKDSIESLIGYFEDGTLELREDCTIVHLLKFPVGTNDYIKQLEFKPRLTQKDINAVKNKNAKTVDTDSFIMDRLAALTGVARELLNNLDTTDMSVCQAIAVFFI